MSLSRRSVTPCSVVTGIARGITLAMALALAGCASDEDYRREAQARAAYESYVATMQQRRAEVEDDGLPSQVPPPAGRRMEPDDPREPYSPNYGRQHLPPPPPLPQRSAAIAAPQAQSASRSVAN